MKLSLGQEHIAGYYQLDQISQMISGLGECRNNFFNLSTIKWL